MTPIKFVLAAYAATAALILAGCGNGSVSSVASNDTTKPRGSFTRVPGTDSGYRLSKRVGNIVIVTLVDGRNIEGISMKEFSYIVPKAAEEACGSDTPNQIIPMITGQTYTFEGATVSCLPAG